MDVGGQRSTFMLWRVLILALFVTTAWACKTTERKGTSEVLSWSSSEEKEGARQQFIKALKDCVPLISAVVPGAKTLRISGIPKREKVVEDFVNRIVENPSAKAERSAELLRYYYNDKGRIFPPCGGEAMEYVLTEFAIHTNAIKVGFGEEEDLKITD